MGTYDGCTGRQTRLAVLDALLKYLSCTTSTLVSGLGLKELAEEQELNSAAEEAPTPASKYTYGYFA